MEQFVLGIFQEQLSKVRVYGTEKDTIYQIVGREETLLPLGRLHSHLSSILFS